MVRIVNLDEDECEKAPYLRGNELPSFGNNDRPNPNYALRFSETLSCYPIVSVLASYLDLTTLQDLSCTCRQFRANLLQYRKLLIENTLHCENEKANPALRLGQGLNASLEQWRNYAKTGEKVGRISSGKVGACARDMVGQCRRCGKIVCRNCVIKNPSANVLKSRFRRLCRHCMKCPANFHTVIPRRMEEQDHVVFRDFARSPCTCDGSVWICQPCGQGLRNADTTYLRGWQWRTMYSACGGIGAGLGEGNEGVECGRDGDCLDAKEIEREIECDADELAVLETEMQTAEIEGRTWVGSSYTTHEIVGIGGKVKKKLTQEVMVGSIVKEYEDERETKTFLRREQDGTNRSWCSWCERVVLGKKDLGQPAKSTDSIASSSSGASD